MQNEVKELAQFISQLATIIDKQETRIRALEIVVAQELLQGEQ